MSDLTLQDYFDAPYELVEAEPEACVNVNSCITHTWHHKLFRVSDYKSPCKGVNAVQVVAVPQKKQVFEFSVPTGTFRLLHVQGWDYPCNTDGITLRRIVRGVFSGCGEDMMEYDYPRGCAFTVIPSGTYRVTIEPVPVNVSSETADGGELDVTIILESVDSNFLAAVQTTRG